MLESCVSAVIRRTTENFSQASKTRRRILLLRLGCTDELCDYEIQSILIYFYVLICMIFFRNN